MEVDVLEKLVGAVGVPAAVLFALMLMAWRVGKWGVTYITPHIPTVVAAYKLQAESVALNTNKLDEIHGDVRTVKGDVGEVKFNVARLVERQVGGRQSPLGGAVATVTAPGPATVAKADSPSQGGNA